MRVALIVCLAIAEKLHQDLESPTEVHDFAQPVYADHLRKLIEKPVVSNLNSRPDEIKKAGRNLFNRLIRLCALPRFRGGHVKATEHTRLTPELTFWQSLSEPPRLNDSLDADRDPFGRNMMIVLILMRSFVLVHFLFPCYGMAVPITHDGQSMNEHYKEQWHMGATHVKKLLHYGETKAAEKLLETLVGFLEPSLHIPHLNGENSNERLNTSAEELWKEYELFRMCMVCLRQFISS